VLLGLDTAGMAPSHRCELPDTPGTACIVLEKGLLDAVPPLVWQLMQRFGFPFTVVSDVPAAEWAMAGHAALRILPLCAVSSPCRPHEKKKPSQPFRLLSAWQS
jgi:hypothetical protein